MAVERASVDGYGPTTSSSTPALAPYPNRERQPSDSIPTQNGAPPHEQHPPPPGHAHSRDVHHPQHRPPPPEVDREAFSILREQVSYNYQCIQQDREALTRFDSHFAHFQSTVMRMLDEFRREMGVKPETTGRADHGDIDVLANQIAAVATKANEIDNLKVQLELMKSKVRRLEQEGPGLQVPRPSSASSHRDGPHEAPQHPPYHGGHPQQHLPPIQTGASGSPQHGRAPSSNYPPQHDPHYAHREHRPPSGEVNGPPHAPPSHRPGEAPPPGWRPAVGVAPLTPHPSTGSVRSTPHDPDSQGPGWAPVNSAQGKRQYEDGHPHEHSAPTSPKRPKLAPLAPLKPRKSLGEEPPTSYPQQPPPPEHYHLNIRLPHHERPPPPQLLTTPASATGPAPPNAYKFIATTPLDASEHWREGEGLTPTSARGRGNRGRARGMRGRGGREGGRENGQEHGTPEWEQKHMDWHPHGPPQHQLSPNGYYAAGRPGPPRVGDALPHEYPLTPIASAVSPSDHSILNADGTTGNKKTRTKPIRNADGILIRKDGRPDMRSVSSANNLRKVHAKKEAERAETDGRISLSTRELAPAGTGFHTSDEEGDDSHITEQADGISRSATPRTQGDSERPDEPERREGNSTDGDKTGPVEHKWISSKYEREGELQEKRRALENGLSDEKEGQKSPVHNSRPEEPRDSEMITAA